MRQVSAPAPKQKEIVVEEERPSGSAAPDMSTAIEVPQAILEAVAAAEADGPGTPVAAGTSAVEAPPPAEPVQAPPSAEPVEAPAPAEPEEPAAEATEAPAVEEAPAPPAEEAASEPEEVSLEAILEDLKRREGRNE
jgi:hypothetical protein